MRQYPRLFIRSSIFPVVILAFSLAFVTTATSQDAYLRRWVVQDPQAGLIQEVASRTINAINFWVTRDNVSAQTARLDDHLEITVIGRIQPSTGAVEEEIVRIRAGLLLIEDDPHLYLSDGLIDTLVTRNYRWRGGDIEILNRALAPAYMTGLSESSLQPTNVLSWAETEAIPLFTKELSSTKSIFLDVGDPNRELPGLSLGAIRFGTRVSSAEVWGEIPLPGSFPDVVGGVVTPSFGLGASIRLDRLRIASGISIPTTDRDPLTGDSVGLGAWSLATLRFNIGQQSGALSLALEGGASLREMLTGSDLINGVVSERSSILVHPYAQLSMVTRGGEPGTHLERIALQTSLVSASISARIRLSSVVHLTGSFSYHGIVGDRDPIMPAMTLWIAPGVTL